MKFAFLLMIGAVIFSTGCGKDPVITPEPIQDPPTIEILASGFNDTIFTTSKNSLFALNVKADTGSVALKVFTVSNDGVKLDVDNFLVNDDNPSSNPILILDANDKNGFTWKVSLRSQDAYDTQTFTLAIEDENGKLAETDIVIVVTEPAPVTDLVMDGTANFEFFNNAGTGFGGIDVRDGSAQSTISGTPHIKDNGGNPWKKTISAAPVTSGFGVSLKTTTGVDFDAVLTQAEILAIYEAGTMVADESNTIAVGDVFVVRVITGLDPNTETTYSLVKFANVNVTGDKDTENYVVNIKR